MCSKISKVAIYGRVIHEEFYPYFKQMLRDLNERGVCLTCYKPFYDFLREKCGISDVFQAFYEEDVDRDTDVLFSVGGDGTFLDSAMRVKNHGVPVLGINSGRLGFLANIAQEEIPQAIHWLCAGDFDVEQRALVKFEMKDTPFAEFNYALNEISVLKTERSSLLKVHAYIGEEYLTTYWADGLIVATPTGSTAYSLSCGGPIVAFGCDNLIITPVSPHNLNMRPLILPGNVQIRLKVESRSGDFMLSADSRMQRMSDNHELFISSGDFKMNVVKMPDHSYYDTLRNKLNWGEDKRNKKDKS